jgi:hypothetical protein
VYGYCYVYSGGVWLLALVALIVGVHTASAQDKRIALRHSTAELTTVHQ